MRRAWLTLGLAIGLLGAGCREVPRYQPPQPQAADLPLTDRAVPAPDASALPDAEPPDAPPTDYYRLTADECRTLACRNSSVANLIQSGVGVRSGPFANCTGRAKVDRLRATAAGYLGQEARTRTAAAALGLYYQLLELELKADVLASSLAELDALVKANETLAAQGFKEAAGVYELKKQRYDLLADRARLRAGVARLNAELKSLLAIDPGTKGFLLPADQVRVVPDGLDPDDAVRLGLARRADLNLLRTLACQLDGHTLLAVRQALVGVAPQLAVVTPVVEAAFLPFVTAVANAEAAAVRRQLLGLLADREREAAKDIRTAVNEWATARDLVALGRKKFELAEARVTELEKRRKAGQSVELDLRTARLDLLKSEADLVGDIAKWKQADVKAREAIGLLCPDDGGGCGG